MGSPGKVVEVIRETDDTTTLRCRLGRPVEFLAGQYFNLRLPVDRRKWPAIRTYSVSSSPFPPSPTVDFTVKETVGGLVSPILVRDTAVGSVVDLDGPFGSFTWDESDGGPLLLVGAGSGIAPLMAMLRYQEARGLTVPTSLLYSNRDRDHIIFSDELESMALRHPWLRVIHTLTMDDTGRSDIHHRHVDRPMLDEAVGDKPGALLAYVCGSPPFVKHVATLLIEIGVTFSRIHVEDWA